MFARRSIVWTIAALALSFVWSSTGVAQRGGGGGAGRGGGGGGGGGSRGGGGAGHGGGFSGSVMRGGSTGGFSGGSSAGFRSAGSSGIRSVGGAQSASFNRSGMGSASNNWHNGGANNGGWNQQHSSFHDGNWGGQGHHDGHNHWDGNRSGSWGWGYPGAWGLGLSLGWGWPGGWGYGGYPYGDYYGGDFYASNYRSYYVSPPSNAVAVQSTFDGTQIPLIDAVEPTTAQDPPEPNPTGTPPYFNNAVTAFRSGNYRAALRSAAHAGIENPKNARPHELASLALFADGEYRGAAMEAHAALALGPASNWDTIVGYYGGANEPFTTQLRSLERYASQNPTAGEANFLLGYLYQGMGFSDQAKTQFAKAAMLAPKDELARKLGGVGTTPPLPIVKPEPKPVPPSPKPAPPKRQEP